jgi:hypothetical protein
MQSETTGDCGLEMSVGHLHRQPLAQKHGQGQLAQVEEQASEEQGQPQVQVQLEEQEQLEELVQL